MNAKQIEYAVAKWIGVRNHIVVPNVSWGLHLHECDLLSISKSGYATEIEIKVSVSDLKRDSSKNHHHHSNRIKFLYFALPKTFVFKEEFVPENAGIISVSEHGYCEVMRRPTPNKLAQPFSTQDQLELARLGVLRMWNLKRTLLNPKDEYRDYSI